MLMGAFPGERGRDSEINVKSKNKGADKHAGVQACNSGLPEVRHEDQKFRMGLERPRSG